VIRLLFLGFLLLTTLHAENFTPVNTDEVNVNTVMPKVLYLSYTEIPKRVINGEIFNIYFIREGDYGDYGNIKIGRSDDVGQRMKALQTGNSQPLSLIATINNVDPKVETYLHHRFARDRIQNNQEFFYPSKELLKFIYLEIPKLQALADDRLRNTHMSQHTSPRLRPIYTNNNLTEQYFEQYYQSHNKSYVKPVLCMVVGATLLAMLQYIRPIAQPISVNAPKPCVSVKTSKSIKPIKTIEKINQVKEVQLPKPTIDQEEYQKVYNSYIKMWRKPNRMTLLTLVSDGVRFGGYIRKIDKDCVSIYVVALKDTLVFDKKSLSPSSKAICYKSEYAKYNTDKQML